jgi:hypothetical protein
MIAAQLLAAHNATMECYRRAMIGEQTLEGRRDNLSQANKLSRTYKRQSLMLTSAPSALIWPDAVDLAASALEPKHFFEPVHAQIFAWLGDMRSRGQRTSAPLLIAQLGQLGHIDILGLPLSVFVAAGVLLIHDCQFSAVGNGGDRPCLLY